MSVQFRAWSSFPTAPFASRLILQALRDTFPNISINTASDFPVDTLKPDAAGLPSLQWCTYDLLSHELTLQHPTTVTTLRHPFFIAQDLTAFSARNQILGQTGLVVLIHYPQKFDQKALSSPITCFLHHETSRLFSFNASICPSDVVDRYILGG